VHRGSRCAGSRSLVVDGSGERSWSSVITMMKKAIQFVSLAVVLLLTLPLAGIAILGFSPTYGMDIFTTLHPSLRWWRELIADPSWAVALLSSGLIGAGSALIALLLTVPATLAWRLEGSTPARNALLLAGASLTVPPIVLAVGLYRMVMCLGLFDTPPGLILAHLAFTVPLCAVILATRFRGTPTEMYWTARSLGASRTAAAFRWLSASQRATLAGCFAASVLTSMSEVTVAIYVTDTSVPTLARRALAGVTRDLKPTGFAALTSWMILLFVVAFVLLRKKERVR
jgi:putative spermidine/putrescine transport system permease protein